MACQIIREEYNPKAKFPSIIWDEAVDKVMAAMKAQNLRERSIEEYLAVLRTLRKVYPASRGPTDITEALAKQFKLTRQQESLSPRTVAGNIGNLSILWGKWFRNELGILDHNPLACRNEKGFTPHRRKPLSCKVPETGLEPALPLQQPGPQPGASANSATPAN